MATTPARHTPPSTTHGHSRESSTSSERVILNIGGTKFETFICTLESKPDTLLGTMFAKRNEALQRPDEMSGEQQSNKREFFFDRDPVVFRSVLNWYRTGQLFPPKGVSIEELCLELDFWQVPHEGLKRPTEVSFGVQMAQKSIEEGRKLHEDQLTQLKEFMITRIEQAAQSGEVQFTLTTKSSFPAGLAIPIQNNENLRELLLAELKALHINAFWATSYDGYWLLEVRIWDADNIPSGGDSQDQKVCLMRSILRQMTLGVEVTTKLAVNTIHTYQLNR